MASKINRKKRIITDLQRLREPPEPHLTKFDIRQEKANDLNVIYTEIRGPPDSYYSDGYFVIRFEFTNDYPVSSPSVAFATKIWHPNVDHNSGSVCLNSLNQNWQPTVNVRHILDTHMPWLLKNGNPDDPLNTDAGTQMKSKDPKYQTIVKQWVKKFASKSQLHSVGSVWYKDQPKKKKRRKKFNIHDLTPKTPKIKPRPRPPPPITINTRKPSKSVGNMDDFQDWWSQSKLLPSTPSKCKQHKPAISRSQSFSAAAKQSVTPMQLRRNTTDYEHNMKLICLDDEEATCMDINAADIPSKVDKGNKVKSPLKKKQKLNDRYGYKQYEEEDNKGNDSDLSSMDEDPIYDLQTYQSLTSFDIQSISQSQSQTPSYNSYNNKQPQNMHRPLNTNTCTNTQESYQNDKDFYKSDIYSKSDGFIPQINSFICPEFSPLSPAKPCKNSNNDSNTILHFAPVRTIYDYDDGNDTDVMSDDDDDDIVPSPNNNNKNTIRHSGMDKSMKNKNKNMIDIDMKDKKNLNVLIANDSNKMSLD